MTCDNSGKRDYHIRSYIGCVPVKIIENLGSLWKQLGLCGKVHIRVLHKHLRQVCCSGWSTRLPPHKASSYYLRAANTSATGMSLVAAFLAIAVIPEVPPDWCEELDTESRGRSQARSTIHHQYYCVDRRYRSCRSIFPPAGVLLIVSGGGMNNFHDPYFAAATPAGPPPTTQTRLISVKRLAADISAIKGYVQRNEVKVVNPLEYSAVSGKAGLS